ncbi:transcriptional repressor LexA [Candidatus Protochlamydia sp. R18]|uniref:transcriptional repressor LexA n=1 Tax=Candidatus Protochlamydia sp. R18 TaxID=1353977 RepID=UPI0005A6DF57|nr:transcriptional repressor LexA [Candidatus Protochlamydia sp. R18]
MKGLTPKQQAILQFIQQFIDTHQYSPSYREIMKHFSLASPASVHKHIQSLQRKGVLAAEKKCSRSLIPTHPPASLTFSAEVLLPLIGNIMAGYPIEMFMRPQTIAVPSTFVHHLNNTYILRVQGNSLSEELIQDGDLLVVEARSTVQPGEIIIGAINHHDTVVKRYYPEGQYIRLESIHINHSSLTLRHDHLAIQGVLTNLIRFYC